MCSSKTHRFLYFADKDVNHVSNIWRVLHIAIYMIVALNAFISSMALGNMFQTFKYNCILFSTDLVFDKEIVKNDYFDGQETKYENQTNFSIYNTTYHLNTSETLLTENNLKEPAVIQKYNNQSILFKNQSHIFYKEDNSIVMVRGKLDVKKSRFSSHTTCNFVLTITLVTFIFALFFGILLVMCSKGGRGSTNNTLNKPQNMVYPMLVTSIIFSLINLASSFLLKNGLRFFCQNFQLFTADKSCSAILNNFTTHERQTNFYFPYFVLIHTYDLTIILFVAQIIISLLRIFYAVDYQLYVVKADDVALQVEDGHINRRLV